MDNTIQFIELKTLEDFFNLQKGDFVACKFKRNIPYYDNCRFRVFEIAENKSRTNEIILDKKHNIYFNFKMFLDGESNLASIVLIK